MWLLRKWDNGGEYFKIMYLTCTRPLLQELGISVLSDLQRQRESILHSRDTLGTVDSSIGKAREVLAVMSRRIMQKKVIMWGVIALLVGAIGLIVWSKLS